MGVCGWAFDAYNEAMSFLVFSGLDDIEKDTILGKDIGGTELSGGQWQSLAISRTVYRNKDFVILEEPTSNLDPVVETEILNKYMSLSQDKLLYLLHIE